MVDVPGKYLICKRKLSLYLYIHVSLKKIILFKIQMYQNSCLVKTFVLKTFKNKNINFF